MRSRFIAYYIGGIFLFIIYANAGSHHPQEFLQSISGSKNEGAQIYEHFCANCHAIKPLIPVGAPRIRIQSDWTIRLQQGMDVLLKHTDEGLNTMPPRGGCFECTDKQLLLAVLFMLPNKTKKTSIK